VVRRRIWEPISRRKWARITDRAHGIDSVDYNSGDYGLGVSLGPPWYGKYLAYRKLGFSKSDAAGYAFMTETPGINAIWGAVEMTAGVSTEPDRFGQKLTTGDYIGHSINIAATVVGMNGIAAGLAAKPRLSTPIGELRRRGIKDAHH